MGCQLWKESEELEFENKPTKITPIDDQIFNNFVLPHLLPDLHIYLHGVSRPSRDPSSAPIPPYCWFEAAVDVQGQFHIPPICWIPILLINLWRVVVPLCSAAVDAGWAGAPFQLSLCLSSLLFTTTSFSSVIDFSNDLLCLLFWHTLYICFYLLVYGYFWSF